MALTSTEITRIKGLYGKKILITRITGDSSYPAAGYPYPAAWGTVAAVIATPVDNAGSIQGFTLENDITNKKLRFMYPQGGTGANDGTGALEGATGIMTAAGADSASLVDHTHPIGTLKVKTGKAKEIETGKNVSAVKFDCIVVYN